MIAFKVLKKEFEAPFENLPSNTGSIEFVGVASEFRKQGVASNIIEHTFMRIMLLKGWQTLT